MTPVRTVFLGSGAFGEPSLRRLAEHPAVELAGCVTAPPRASGRGGRPRETPVAAIARERSIPVLAPGRLRDPDAIAAVLALRPALAVLADYGQLVPAPILELEHGALNLHPSLLPRHRGATPIPATILAGERETGVSLFRMDAGLDTGPIVAVERVELTGVETAPGLEARLATVAADLLARSLAPWLRGELVALPQPALAGDVSRPLRREDGRLDPLRPAVELERQVRAYQPWPGSWLDTPSGRLVAWAARPVAAPEGAPAGALLAEPGRLVLVTADGGLELVEVQLPGGRRMTAAELLRGRGRRLLESPATTRPASGRAPMR